LPLSIWFATLLTWGFPVHRVSWKGKKKKKKKDDKSKKEDLYALLGLQNERWTATEAQIKLGEHRGCEVPIDMPNTSAQCPPGLPDFSSTMSEGRASETTLCRLDCLSPCSLLMALVLLGVTAYRKAALEHHPDKAGAACADEDTKQAIEEKFKSIQEAYETLSDPSRRREYDSTDDFDDTLPVDCAPEDFFKVCMPPLH
jgi:hypothetical protein